MYIYIFVMCIYNICMKLYECGLERFSNESGRSGLTEVPTQVPAEDVGKGEQFQGQEHPKQTIKPKETSKKTRNTQKKIKETYPMIS